MSDLENRVGYTPAIETEGAAGEIQDDGFLPPEIDELLAEIELLKKQLDSARRTYGEELSIFASSINKRLDKLEKAVDNNG